MQGRLTQATQVEVKRAESLEGLLDRFISYLDVSQSSIKTYHAGVKNFLNFLADKEVTQPTRDTIVAYKKEVTARYSASTANLYMASVRKFFSWLSVEGLYTDITAGVKGVKVDTGHKRDCFTASQVKGIITGINRESLKGKRDYALFCLLSATGLRTVEVMRANIEDVRNICGETVLYIQGKGKTSKSDFVKLSQPVCAALQEYLTARGKTAITEPLFISVSHRNFGERITTRSISRIAKQAMKCAEYNSKRLTCHSLRHTAVTLALLAGMDIRQVSQFARHSSITVTLIYAHDVERIKSKVENAISNAIFG